MYVLAAGAVHAARVQVCSWRAGVAGGAGPHQNRHVPPDAQEWKVPDQKLQVRALPRRAAVDGQVFQIEDVYLLHCGQLQIGLELPLRAWNHGVERFQRRRPIQHDEQRMRPAGPPAGQQHLSGRAAAGFIARYDGRRTTSSRSFATALSRALADVQSGDSSTSSSRGDSVGQPIGNYEFLATPGSVRASLSFRAGRPPSARRRLAFRPCRSGQAAWADVCRPPRGRRSFGFHRFAVSTSRFVGIYAAF
mmetsp:Transcript_69561/g.213261  ORF Transcript_69561/g.213261 Transcript_69561/m.213261 type:complete len:249 (-) Transcript_69561:72-818(-)